MQSVCACQVLDILPGMGKLKNTSRRPLSSIVYILKMFYSPCQKQHDYVCIKKCAAVNCLANMSWWKNMQVVAFDMLSSVNVLLTNPQNDSVLQRRIKQSVF